MTRVFTTNIEDYNRWLKFKSFGYHVTLLTKPDEIERFELSKAFTLNAIPDDWSSSFGNGIYKINKIETKANGYGSTNYYAEAYYKTERQKEFNTKFKVNMYLNPLIRYKSVGRFDFPIENLEGAIIEVLGAEHISPDTKNEKSPKLHYSWRILAYPVREDGIPNRTIDVNDDAILDF